VNEATLKAAVVNVARMNGWLIHHDLPAMNTRGRWATHTQGDVGFPDLVLLSPHYGQLLVVELKAEKGRITTSQQNWLDAFDLTGIENHVIRPSDLEFITHRLSRPELYK